MLRLRYAEWCRLRTMTTFGGHWNDDLIFQLRAMGLVDRENSVWSVTEKGFSVLAAVEKIAPGFQKPPEARSQRYLNRRATQDDAHWRVLRLEIPEVAE